MVKIDNKTLLFSTSFLMTANQKALISIPGFTGLEVELNITDHPAIDSSQVDNWLNKHHEGSRVVYSLGMLAENESHATKIDTFLIQGERLFQAQISGQGIGNAMLINFSAFERDVTP